MYNYIVICFSFVYTAHTIESLSGIFTMCLFNVIILKTNGQFSFSDIQVYQVDTCK